MTSKNAATWWEDTVVANPILWGETVLGIDWGEASNAWALMGYQGRVLEQGFVQENPAGVATLMDVLRRYAHPETGALPPVSIETPRRLLVSALTEQGVTVVPLNPRIVKNARGIKHARNASKTDPKDAALIADTLRTHPGYYRGMHQATDAARAITLLQRARTEAVRGALRQALRVRSALAEYHPNAVAAFTTEQMADNLAPYWVLIDALTPAQGQRLRADGIATRLMKPGGRGSTKSLDIAAERIRDALHRPSLSYPPGLEAAFAETVRTDLQALRAAVEHRINVEKRLTAAVQAHPYWDLLAPATGAGPAVIAAIIAEVSDDPHRFDTADNLMAFAGSAPAINQSGGRAQVRRRDVKGNRLHDAMWHWSGSVILHNPAARNYYWSIRAKGSAHPHALRKVMNRLLRALHVCITTGTVWDDTRLWRTDKTAEEIEAFVAETRAALKAVKQSKRQVAGAA